MSSKKKIRVGILYGGRSAEHEVSIESARALIGGMNRDRYELMPIGIDLDGNWHPGAEPDKMLEVLQTRQLEAAPPADDGDDVTGTVESSALVKDAVLENRLSAINQEARIDVVFPLIHGTYGEDGRLQGLMDMAGVAYVGSGVLGSSVCMDKWAQKLAAKGAGIPVVPFVAFRARDYRSDAKGVEARIARELGFPNFVKPSNGGSSRGMTKVKSADQVKAALEDAFQYDDRVVVEKGIDARELETAILGNEFPRASRVGEILPQKEWYDFEAKYSEGGMKLEIPADIPHELEKRIQETALHVFSVFDCSGIARVDFFQDRKDGALYLNELNTIPGFTAMSVYSKLWAASGLLYSDLVDELIRLAIERHGRTLPGLDRGR